ncbi:hypothetical protein MPER_09564 [Moniliophthora perniciosa FA553]|nr:hypothetical protein MPER_09564 [Moniliophthora perniciosa FA553]
MDLILLMSMLNCVLMMLFISYDIACQWFKNFLERMHEMPAYLHLPKYTTLHFKVPKFHLPAHVPSCFAPFSFNFTKGVGKVDGEGIERQWSLLNPVARSLSMMSAGGRSDTLDDFCNFLNWRKDYWSWTRYGGKIDEWEHQVLEWEKDRKKFCPYDRPERVITIAKVKKRLAEEDHKREIKGENAKQTTASVMIIEGLEIEDVQYVLLPL